MAIILNNGIPLVPASGSLAATDAAVAVKVTGTGTGGSSQIEGNVASGATDSGNPVKIGAKYNILLPTFTDGQRGDAQITAKGMLITTISDATGNPVMSALFADGATNGNRGLQVSSYQMKFNGVAWDRDRKPNATSRIISAAATTNATTAKASAGDVHMIHGFNAAVTARYLKLYDKASNPTVGTDTPVLTFTLPPLLMFQFSLDAFYFSTGIAYALTTGVADADTGALTAADVTGLNISYS